MSGIQMVNGFPCKDCTDVGYAQKHIDPAHPKDGPYGIDAKNDPQSPDYQRSNTAVTFGGQLANLTSQAVSPAASSGAVAQPTTATTSPQTGGLINLTV